MRTRATALSSISDLDRLAAEIRACRICVERPAGKPMAHEPRPVLRVSTTARLLVAGQAPGARVHASGLPFDDPSGDRLRMWMGVDRDTFYDEARIAFLPTGLCFPGYDAKGYDLPPRRECASLWHERVLALMPQVETILAVGGYAQRLHAARAGRPIAKTAKVDEIVRDWRRLMDLRPRIIPTPHPSWRNNAWLKRNPWFEAELLPELRAAAAAAISG